MHPFLRMPLILTPVAGRPLYQSQNPYLRPSILSAALVQWWNHARSSFIFGYSL